jgi:flagellar basal-body rod modification protein FlgD
MAIEAIGLSDQSAATTPSSATVSQDQFLKILLAQLRFQDPLKPMDNQQFVAQLAQFSALEINRQQSLKIDTLLEVQAGAQALGLIGRNVDALGPTGEVLGTGEVIAVSFRTGEPLLTLKDPNSQFTTDVRIANVQLVREQN